MYMAPYKYHSKSKIPHQRSLQKQVLQNQGISSPRELHLFYQKTLLPRTFARGKEGHYAVCKIAEGLLTEVAASAVKVLLTEYAKGDLANVCSWPDLIRFHYHWSGPLQYFDTPDFRYGKMNSTILSWENEKKVKAKRRIERIENQLDKRRAMTLQSYRIKISKIDQVAGGAKSLDEERKRNEDSKTKEKASKIRSTGKVPVKCFCF